MSALIARSPCPSREHSTKQRATGPAHGFDLPNATTTKGAHPFFRVLCEKRVGGKNLSPTVLGRWRSKSGFIILEREGHGFSRAIPSPKSSGFSRCGTYLIKSTSIFETNQQRPSVAKARSWQIATARLKPCPSREHSPKQKIAGAAHDLDLLDGTNKRVPHPSFRVLCEKRVGGKVTTQRFGRLP